MNNEQISREAFEIWAKPTTPYPDFDRNDSGFYESPVIRAKWAAWQAGVEFMEKEYNPLVRVDISGVVK